MVNYATGHWSDRDAGEAGEDGRMPVLADYELVARYLNRGFLFLQARGSLPFTREFIGGDFVSAAAREAAGVCSQLDDLRLALADWRQCKVDDGWYWPGSVVPMRSLERGIAILDQLDARTMSR